MVDVEHRTDDLADVRPLVGRDAIEATARAWLDDTPEFEYELVSVLASGRKAAVRWRYAVGGSAYEGLSWLDCERGEIREALVCFDSHRLLRDSGRA
jgi:hypothetical protein